MEILSFEQQIRRLRRHVLIRAFSQAVFWLLFILLALYALLLVVERVGMPHFQQQQTVAFYGGMFAVAIAGSAIISIATRKRFLERLIEIDSRLKLRDVLSTAYEYKLSGKSSGFREMLIEDAGRHLSRLSRRQLLPLTFSWAHAFFIVLLLLNVGLLALERFAPSPQQLAFGDKVQTERQIIQPEARPQNSREQPENKEQQELARKLQNMAKQLKEKTLSPQDFSTQLHEALQEIQSSQDRLADGAASENDSIELDDMPIEEVPQSPPNQAIAPRSVEELEELLKNMLSEQSGAENFGEPLTLSEEERQQLSELLNELADELELDASSRRESTSEENFATAQAETDSDQTSEGDSEQAENEEMTNSQQGGQADTEDENSRQMAGGGRGRGSGEEMYEDEYGDAYSFGRGPGTGKEYAPSFPETSRNPVVRDKILSLPKEEYNVHIRSVTSIGKAEVPEEALVRPYRQDVESILQKEEMPVNYREFIKNYFMSIGLTQEQE